MTTRRKPAGEESETNCAHPDRTWNNGRWYCTECGDSVE